MKISTLPFLFCLLPFLTPLHAQNPGCNGSRYIDDVFTSVTKTTVAYAPSVNQSGVAVTLSMDVYQPAGDNLSQRPVVVLAHGGSFVFGDKSQMQVWCERLAKKGYIAVSIQYRLYPVFTLGFPDSIAIFDSAVKAVGDMKAAVRYFREDAATTNQFRADPAHIFIGGYSAGAVTALHAGFLDADDNIPTFLQTLLTANGGLEGISGSATNKTYSSHTDAVVSLSGGLYRSEWIDANESPLVSIHGTADATVFYTYGLAANVAYLEGSSLLHARAESIGLWNYLQTVSGAGHTNLYESVLYKPQVDSFWVAASTLLESLTCATTATQEKADAQNWSVAPNPATESVRLTWPTTMQRAEVAAFDALGRVVMPWQPVDQQAVLSIANWPAGNYWLQLRDASAPGQRFVAKTLIKD
ncbi:MAG: carboxylesterase family protein [Saprospiraceae bacterium]|nr:carboxylesterase family protein [Saprospiraceae bacterium]